MSNDFYTKTGNPATQARGLSSQVRNEFSLIEQAFDEAEAAIDLKAPIASPTFTGAPTAPTPTVGDSSTKLATTAFVTAAAMSPALPGQLGQDGKGVKSYAGAAGWYEITTLLHLEYDSRGDLRTTVPEYDAEIAVAVEGLGVFQHSTGSTELDDDETCFATSTGRWLISAVNWDFVDARITYDIEELWDDIDTLTIDVDTLTTDIDTLTTDVTGLLSDVGTLQTDVTGVTGDVSGLLSDVGTLQTEMTAVELAAAAAQSTADAITGRVLTATVAWTLTSLVAVTQTSTTVTVTGAAVGDAVVVTPPNALTGRLSVFGLVTSTNTVTIYANNPSAATATLTSGTWRVVVIKP